MPATSAPEGRGAPQPSERRLESWGEIASYLHREIRTVQRWERNLGLPVHRLRVGQNASVFAYPSELDKWFQEREEYIKNDKQGDSNSGAAGASAVISAAGGSVSDAPISGDAVVISPAGSSPASGCSLLPASGVAGYGGAAPSAATENQVPARSSEAGGRDDNKWTKWAAGAAII